MQNPQEMLAPHQIICWKCEEVVHSFASQCPYCMAELSKEMKGAKPSQTHDKITSLPTLMDHTSEDESRTKPRTSMGSTLISLFFLFAGCNLLFLAILIGLFSKDGYFTLQWKEVQWPAFFGCGIALVTFGMLSFKDS